MKSEDFFKRLIQSNFINMIRNKDRRAFAEFRNNPIYLRDLLIAMGADEEVLGKPAHLEQLEEVLVEIVDELSESLENQKADIGYEVKFDDQDSLIVRIESFSTQDDYKLRIMKGGYTFENSKIRSGIGNTKRTIQGLVSKKQIMDLKSFDGTSSSKSVGRKLLLDDFGFVVDELDAEKEISYTDTFGTFEREKTTSKRGSHISRDGINVTNRKSSIVQWNGDPLHLNDEKEDEKDTHTRALITTIKCPSVKKYYEDLLGISIDDMLKKLKIQE